MERHQRRQEARRVRRRRVGRWGHSLAVTLSPEACQALGVTKGSELVEVVTPEGVVELQPLTAPTAAAADRRAASDVIRDLQDQIRRLRAEARAAWSAGHTQGLFSGATLAIHRAMLEWEFLRAELRAFLAAAREQRGADGERRP